MLRVLSCYLINYALIWLYWVNVSLWTIILVTRIQYRSTVEAISTPSALIVERKWYSVFCWVCSSSPVWRQQGEKINCTSRHSSIWVNSTIIQSNRYFNRFCANHVAYASLSSFFFGLDLQFRKNYLYITSPIVDMIGILINFEIGSKFYLICHPRFSH